MIIHYSLIFINPPNKNSDISLVESVSFEMNRCDEAMKLICCQVTPTRGTLLTPRALLKPRAGRGLSSDLRFHNSSPASLYLKNVANSLVTREPAETEMHKSEDKRKSFVYTKKRGYDVTRNPHLNKVSAETRPALWVRDEV